jgi:hypothetical protein
MDLDHLPSFLLTMGPMIPIYLLVIPFLVGLVNETTAKIGVIIAGLWAIVSTFYLIQWTTSGFAQQMHMTSYWAILFIAISGFILAFCAAEVLFSKKIVGKAVYIGALFLHVGMFLGMWNMHMPG